MKNILNLNFILWIIILLSSCDLFECENPVAGSYEFQLPATLTPAKDTFRIGDTIRVKSTFSNQVFERKTQKDYTLDDFLFFPATLIGKLDTTPVIRHGIDYFDYFVCDSCEYEIRLFNSGLKSLEGQYRYDGTNYYLEYGLIPREAGLFILGQASSVMPDGRDQDFPGRCGAARSAAYVQMNGGGDNNLQFLQGIPDTAYYELIMDKLQFRYYDSGGYCFYVVE